MRESSPFDAEHRDRNGPTERAEDAAKAFQTGPDAAQQSATGAGGATGADAADEAGGAGDGMAERVEALGAKARAGASRAAGYAREQPWIAAGLVVLSVLVLRALTGRRAR